MAKSSRPLLDGWRYGLHPRAVGKQVRTFGRIQVPLGEALRLELVDDGPGAPEMSHVQYYISTDVGPWALWISCPTAELADREATLQRLAHPASDGAED